MFRLFPKLKTREHIEVGRTSKLRYSEFLWTTWMNQLLFVYHCYSYNMSWNNRPFLCRQLSRPHYICNGRISISHQRNINCAKTRWFWPTDMCLMSEFRMRTSDSGWILIEGIFFFLISALCHRMFLTWTWHQSRLSGRRKSIISCSCNMTMSRVENNWTQQSKK